MTLASPWKSDLVFSAITSYYEGQLPVLGPFLQTFSLYDTLGGSVPHPKFNGT